MIVCAHGEITEYCESHGMTIGETYCGDLSEYAGDCPVVVTSQEMSEPEYYWLKGKLLARGVELLSTRYVDDPKVTRYLAFTLRQEAEQRRQKYGGRVMFGFQRKDGELIPHPENMKAVRRILELRDAGYTLKQIRDAEGVRKQDGGKLSISTIQVIIRNRERYEDG